MKSKKLRRALGIVIAAVMVFSMVPAMAMAEEETQTDEISYELTKQEQDEYGWFGNAIIIVDKEENQIVAELTMLEGQSNVTGKVTLTVGRTYQFIWVKRDWSGLCNFTIMDANEAVILRKNGDSMSYVEDGSLLLEYVMVAADIPANNEITVADGTTTNSYVPAYPLYNFGVSQCIVPASELASISGKTITAMKYYISQSDNFRERTVDILLSETESTTLATFEDVKGVTAVFSGTWSRENNKIPITFTNTYQYNGGNLLVTVVDRTGQWGSGHQYVGILKGASISGYSDGTEYSFETGILPNPSVREFLPKMTFTYEDSEPTTPTLNEALNVEGGTIHFTSDGTYPWIAKADTERTYAQSGNAEKPMSISELTANVNLAGAGTLSFDYKACGESGDGTPFDECLFAVDNVVKLSYGQQGDDWKTYSEDLSAGNHTLTWKYTKDDSVNPDGDFFAVDNVSITEATPAEYNINVTGGKAYSDGNCTQEITKAKQGDTVYIYQDVVEGKYAKSITFDPDSIEPSEYSEKAMGFKMPGQDVTITITFDDQTPLTIDLSEGSAVVDTYEFEAVYSALYPDQMIITNENSEYTLDLDKNGTDDVKVTVKTFGPPDPPTYDMVVLEETNSVKDEITLNEPNISPYWPVTVKFAETPVETLKITTTKLANGTVGKEYSQKLEANYDDVTWRIEGELPEGLELDGNTISGTPTEKGSFPITVKAEKGSETDTKEFTITITEKASSGGGASGTVSFVLTYNTNGGSEIKAESHKVGDEVTLDKTPVKDGYTFTGWYADKECTQKIESVTMNSSKTVYAGWSDGEQPVKPDENAPLMVIRIGDTKYQLNGVDMEMDAAPFIDENDRTMLPVRVVANALGISDEDIAWDNETKTASFTRPDGKVVSCTVGEKAVKIGDDIVEIDTAPVIANDRIFLPMRALFNAFNVSDDHIIWDGAEKTVTVTKEAIEDIKSI